MSETIVEIEVQEQTIQFVEVYVDINAAQTAIDAAALAQSILEEIQALIDSDGGSGGSGTLQSVTTGSGNNITTNPLISDSTLNDGRSVSSSQGIINYLDKAIDNVFFAFQESIIKRFSATKYTEIDLQESSASVSYKTATDENGTKILASREFVAANYTTPSQVVSAIAPLASDIALKADLVGGVVPSAQLPSFVDDVLEYTNFPGFPVTGESGKIYLALDTNKSYRWSGSIYVHLDDGINLGETSSTAYRGDRGKTAYDHSQVATGNPHNSTTDDISESGTPTNKWFTNARAIASVLTGFTSGSGVVAATDTILQAIQKIVGNIDLKVDKADFVDYSSTSTIVGWSAFVTKVIRYQPSYKRYMLFIDVDGTSNSATTTITLPIAPAVSGVYFTYSKNSGVVSTGTLELTSGSTTAVFKSSVAGSNYSSSGGKRVHISLTIETT